MLGTGMIKIIAYKSQDLGALRQLELVKISRDGLRSNDFKDFIKRASWQMADIARSIPLFPGDRLIHGIALGAKEVYGPNRNGDAFKAAALRDHHNTFVKYGHWYRNHENKDPAKSYGIVKHSHFDEDMKRVELLAILNGTKEAAARNGGLVADDEIKALEEGRDIPTSMACKVAYDVCAGCGNRAAKRDYYCLGTDEGGMCKRGGVKNRMCFVHDDGFMNHVENPQPAFFDWSHVYRGADRISYADGLVKAASGLLMGGAELADVQGLELPPYMFSSDTLWPTRLEKLAAELAQLELECERRERKEYDLALSSEFTKEASVKAPEGETRQVLAALAMQKIALPVKEWLQVVHGELGWASTDMIQSSLPGIYGRMLADGSIKEASALLPSLNASVPYELTKWARNLAEDFSLDTGYLTRRVKRAALYGYTYPQLRGTELIKTAGAAEQLARGYALYKLAFLTALRDRDEAFETTKQLVVRQNYL